MIDEHVQHDTFTPPLHTLLGDMRKSLNQLLEKFKLQFAQMKQVLEQLISQKCKLKQVTQYPSDKGHTPFP